MTASRIYYIHALSPLHMGTGLSTGAVELPHSREVSTGLPNAPGSGIKGVLRDELHTVAQHSRLFGADHSVADRSQSALLFSDAQLLCMPVVSYVGDFAWITSPLALARFSRERRFCGAKPEPPAAIPRCASGVEVSVAQSTLLHDKAVFFRDVKLPAIESADALKWASVIAAEVFGRPNHGANGAGGYSFHDAFVARFAIVSDADFLMFSQSGTDVRTRNRLDDNKQVMDGQLWSEESMPAESIFWGTVVADAIDLSPDGGRDATKPSEWMESFSNGLKVGPQCDAARVVQFGGKASVGRGQCRFILGGVQHG